MLPWGHLAVGYLLYSAGVRLVADRKPAGLPVISLAIGTQFPDLVDKPLADVLNLLPSGRSLGHSLLFTLVLLAVVYLLARRYDRLPEAIAFSFGHISHIVADALPAAIAGEWAKLGFLGWPITPAYRYSADVEGRVITEYLFIQLTSSPHHELVLFVFAAGLWFYDGMPGFGEVMNWLEMRREN